MGNLLYNLFIQPLELLIELIFTIMSRISGNYGLAIIMVSVVVNILIFPLYKRSDAMQELEHKKQKEMEPWVKHIRKTFRGDERFMMLQTYYRQQDYQPASAIRGSFSLLLQIPFFIAAYHFLSSIDMQGVSFLFIPNLSSADHLIKLGPLALNLLPILMTAFNLLSAAIYLHGSRLRDKIQTLVLALAFLVILYRSPSGLVLYWTMNNFFSLLKNLIMKLIGPAISRLGLFSHGKKERPVMTKKETIGNTLTFVLGALLISLISGFLIPAAAVSASPEDFLSVNSYVNPVSFIFNTFFVTLGIFLVWGGIIFFVSRDHQRKTLSAVFWCISVCAVLNYMAFGRKLGTISPLMRINDGLKFSAPELIISTALVILLTAGCVIIFIKVRNLTRPVLGVLIAGVLILGIRQTYLATNEIKDGGYTFSPQTGEDETITPILPLSREGKNVVVIMLDRAINDYFPFILEEKPELKEAFDGFVYYPNTISYGMYTVYGTPTLFGGYEYTPKAMNERSDVSLEEKQNEALKVMPVTFLKEGYEVTVCDPPYAGYEEIPDLSIYDEYPEINTYITQGKYVGSNAMYVRSVYLTQKRNFVYYGLMKIIAPVLQKYVYDYGNYYEIEKKHIQEPEFIGAYTVLDNLDLLTGIREGSGNTFFMIDNNTTHAPCLLSQPDYTPSDSPTDNNYDMPTSLTLDGRTMDLGNSMYVQHYHVNVAAYLKLGEWFDYLREQDVYDNTRIIIVADHGRDMKQFEDLIVDEYLDVEGFHPILLFKDFNSTGLTTDMSFMTNADVPVMAFKDLIDSPLNPFTGKALNDNEKYAHDQYVTTSPHFELKENTGNTFNTGDSYWYSVHDNIFDKSNWKREE